MGDGWYGWWAQDDIEAHLDELHSILADHDRSVTDDDFSFKLGLPLSDESPDAVAEKATTASRLGVEELVLAAPVPTSSYEAVLSVYAEACGIS